MGRRLLITGLSSFWGGLLAQRFERDPQVEVIVGLDTSDPVVELERTEFVRADESFSILSRLVRATQVDTVVHAALVVDSANASARVIHEQNVIGTMNLLAAVAAEQSAVRTLVVKSSTLVYGAGPADPTWFSEGMTRTTTARTRVERSLLEVEGALRAFAEENLSTRVTVLRCANVLGGELSTTVSRALTLPLTPTVAGFDPLLQFVEEGDVVRAIHFVVAGNLDGVYNVAGDGRLPWSEVLAIADRHPLLLPPVLAAAAAVPLRAAGVSVTPELIDLLRYGRGVDNTKLKAAGFRYRHDSAGAVHRFAQGRRLRRATGGSDRGYRYRSDVETFFRHSPSVVRPPGDTSR